ncbi:hypothetical protein MVEN_00437600 [Mycena venus]|uniref:Uncharacterized protein n=1 Tax=Mycena venus TaxID=2733690 RepID=A0A8H6YR02_9AGAR|nr:hypothetical protein MVEN_00437600 [Mycena venus]
MMLNLRPSYQENTPIPGPEIDVEVEVQCTFSLSRPLAYTRGSVIPCSITYFCRDFQALNLLCTPTSINVLLHREVKCSSLARSPWADGSSPSLNDVEESGRAVWWQVNDGSPRQDTRKFQGEIQLAKTLKPTSAICHFAVKYFVVVMPFEATGFFDSRRSTIDSSRSGDCHNFCKGSKTPLLCSPWLIIWILKNLVLLILWISLPACAGI